MHELNILFHHPAGYIKLLHAWTSVTGEVGDFPLVERSARQEIMDGSLKPDIRRCARAIYDAVRAMSLAAPENVDAGDVERALKEVLEHMSVYRTYLGWGDATEHDASVIEHAVKTARRSDDPTHDRIRELIRECLLTPPAQDGSEHRNATWRLARIRFEQLSSALEAKAVEDTGFYRFTPLLSLNEVGGKPQALSFQPQRFHQAMHARAERWPLSLSPLATHDHKRGADTRARLAVISERADGFAIGFDAWLQQLGTRSAPSRMALWGLYQTLLAAWPLKLEPTDNTGLAEFAKRIEQWFIKAEREAKRDTSWVKCNEVYEKACRDIVSDLLLSERCAPLRHAMHETARSLDAAGALIGMAMTTLQLTAPGVPDIYQGSEYWDLSLVDPDNRRAVDYHARQMSLDVDVSLDTLLADFRDDTLKQHLIYRLLQLRKAWPELFLCGNYEPLRVTGERADHIVGFTRRHNGRQLVVAVPRLCADAMENVTAPLPSVSFWGNTRVDIVNRDEACTFTDLFSHAKRGSDPEAWSAASLFSSWPLCVMISASGSDECEALFRRQATPYQ